MPEHTPSAEAKTLKKLVIFHSHSGNTRFIAEAIAQEVGAEILEIKPKTPLPASPFWAMLKGVRQTLSNEKPELLPLTRNPQEYDVLYLGTPVWGRKPSAPMQSFLAKRPIQGKTIALFCTSGGTAGDTLKMLREQLGGNQILGEMGFPNPLKNQAEAAKQAKQWAQGILQRLPR